ncbi:MAG: hypothetical protein DWQ02_19280 [Bacteroidetes bacterium]|nr:MAG: hypothetical protein DWQ02_19280 [Bacteroidota bacterium]
MSAESTLYEFDCFGHPGAWAPFEVPVAIEFSFSVELYRKDALLGPNSLVETQYRWQGTKCLGKMRDKSSAVGTSYEFI